jgi:hypothetical protein
MFIAAWVKGRQRLCDLGAPPDRFAVLDMSMVALTEDGEASLG